MAVGGDIIEVTFNHPTLGSGTLFPKSDEDSTYDLGGFRSNDDESSVDGGGNDITILTRKRWGFEVPVAWDGNIREDLEKVVAMAGDPAPADWTFTHVNGTIYGGTGRPVGDLKGAGKNATFPLKVAGGGLLKKIS